jgi:hypothetical protein
MKQAFFSKLIDEKKYSEAASLLKQHIKEAEIIDPRRDDSWGIDSDILGYTILDKSGVDAFCSYWQEFLQFFIEEMEPSWGHLHKGHIFLRLGTGYLATDLNKSVEYLKAGLEEDRLVAVERKKKDPGLDIEEIVRDSPANITLCTIRILDKWSYPSEELKQSFFRDLVRVKFDVIWGPQEVDPNRVQRALGKFNNRNREYLIAAVHELNRVFDQRLPLAIMSTLESFLKIFLRDRISANSATAEGFALESLSDLVAAIQTEKLFPDPTIAAVFQMTGILCTVFPLIPTTEPPEELTPRVLSQISVMIKILVDLALIGWSELS